MPTIICYPSALEFWLTDRRNIYDTFPYKQSNILPVQAINSLDYSYSGLLNDLQALNLKSPVHLIVPRSFVRHSDSSIVFHSISGCLPEGSFVQLKDSVYIASPELCFLQAANSLEIPLLVKLANDLCAIYEKTQYSDYGQQRREPVTNVANIKNYLKKAENIKGIKKARIAIKYASDRSNSPIESALAVLASLPLRYGGYNLSPFCLNHRIKVTKEGSKMIGRDYCECDMVWPKLKVVVEYDSNLAHFDKQKFYKDKNRSSALAISGYTVIHVTYEQLKSFSSIEDVFLMIRKTLKLPPYPDRLLKHREARVSAVEKLFLEEFKLYAASNSFPTA